LADRTMEVDHHHRVALACIGLRVPAVAPAIAEAALRSAVDQEGDRVALALLVVPGLEYIAVHGLVVPALELELLEAAKPHLGQHLAGRRRDGPLRRTVDPADDDLVAAGQAVAS